MTAYQRPLARLQRHNASLRNYLYWSTLLGVFSAMFVVRIPFAIRLFDVLMLINLPLMSLLVDFARIPVWVISMLVYLALSGGIGIANDTDTAAQVAKEFSGIAVSLLYYYYFFKLIKNDFERAFATYTKIAFWFAIIAFPLWVAASVGAHGYERLRGLTTEPDAFCELTLPAYYWYVYLSLKYRMHRTEVVVFTFAIALAGSSLGFLGVAFGAMLLLSGRKKHFIAAPIVISTLIGVVYASSADFRLRADDTLLALSSGDVTGVNLSTYALISNVFITQKVLQESPVIGNGLGSHLISHERFLDYVPGVDSFVERGAANLNAPDAGSFTLRVLSEFGISGFLCVLGFLFYFHVGGNGPRAAISNAILVCFFLKLIRGGIYFQPEQFFFIFIYMLNYWRFKRETNGLSGCTPLKLLTSTFESP